MTKRPSPFEPNICRQSKIHLNNYENDIIALKDVKEQTLRKLFEGPKNLHSICLSKEINSNLIANEMHSKDNFTQKLVTNYITVNGRGAKKIDDVVRSPSDSSFPCSFCDSETKLTFQCIHCEEFYCTNCSFYDYDSFEDKRICLSCS